MTADESGAQGAQDTRGLGDYRGRIEIEVDFDAPFTDASIELVRLAGCAIEAIGMQPDVDDVRGLDHRLEDDG